MAILCCTPDSQIMIALVALCARHKVIERAGIEAIEGDDLRNCETVIVDLKYVTIPEGHDLLKLPTLALTETPGFEEAMILLQRGVRGYGNRHMRPENLIQALQNIQSGQIWLPPEIIGRLIATVGPGYGKEQGSDLFVELSVREREVAGYVAKGMSNQEIAERMYVSVRTVKAHLSSIYDKTGLRNRLELGLNMRNAGGHRA